MTRRPIKTRGAAWVQKTAGKLTTAGITPNQISQASMLFAALAFLAFSGSNPAAFANLLHPAIYFVLAALCIQLRLLCNLLDGIVAVEGGKSTPDGAFWNEAPDRAADLMILAGLGLACGQLNLGLFASGLAIAAAYIRELGRAEGMPADFSGPFAKPQRMAAATLAAVLAAIATLTAPAYTVTVLTAALWVITLGTGYTVFMRSRRLIAWLKLKG